jgi:hypothetical protein
VFFTGTPARVNVGTGIAYGPVTLGIMGHSRRVDFTTIGDTVNLASRLESLTKEYLVSILINDTLYNAVDPGLFHLRHIDRIRVKGRSQPVNIYEEFSADSAPLRDMKLKLLPDFKALQEMYFSGENWDDAIQLGNDLTRRITGALGEHHLEGPGDHLPAIYVQRMKTILENPERFANWDGVYTFDWK